MIVTDIVRKNLKGEIKRGFYMEDALAINLSKTPKYLAKEWDVVGIVSGTALVRNGKSTLAGKKQLMLDKFVYI